MDYNLENKILLSEESEYKSLYSWSLQEFNKEDKKIGRDLIPWNWSVYFTASELCHNYSFGIHKSENANADIEPNKIKENIFGILHSGVCRDGKNLEAGIVYSMFGTDRRINHFRLTISKAENSWDKETCYIHGFVSYTAEVDFREETTNDDVYINLVLMPQQFNTIVELIKTKQLDILEIHLKNVSGFYSDWSPSVSTNYIKILTDSETHRVVMQEGCKINPLRLGSVSEFNMSITQRHILNPKQDLRGVDIDKLFEESEDYEEDDVQPSAEDKILSQLAQNGEILKKLTTPIWLILIILCYLLIKFT